MKLFKDGITREITDPIQVRAFLANNWIEVDEVEQELNPAPTDYNAIDDATLAAIASEYGIDITGKTKRQTINALKKAGVSYDE